MKEVTISTRGVPRLDGGQSKKQVWRSHVGTYKIFRKQMCCIEKSAVHATLLGLFCASLWFGAPYDSTPGALFPLAPLVTSLISAKTCHNLSSNLQQRSIVWYAFWNTTETNILYFARAQLNWSNKLYYRLAEPSTNNERLHKYAIAVVHKNQTRSSSGRLPPNYNLNADWRTAIAHKFSNSPETNNKAYLPKQCGFHSSGFRSSSVLESSLFQMDEFVLYCNTHNRKVHELKVSSAFAWRETGQVAQSSWSDTVLMTTRY